jgi:hypothetical protein
MRNCLWIALVFVLAAFNVALLWENHSLQAEIKQAMEQPVYLAHSNGQTADMRGMYTYPGIGRHFFVDDSARQHLPTPLTLAIFLSARTSCPAVLSEVEAYRRLRDSFSLRGQRVVAVVESPDSTRIQFMLDSLGLNLPLYSPRSDSGLSLYQIGISYAFMPFKVLYDRHNTAIFARGADNSPESQMEFERVALELSELTAKGAI